MQRESTPQTTGPKKRVFSFENFARRIVGLKPQKTLEELKSERSELRRGIQIKGIEISVQLPIYKNTERIWYNLRRDTKNEKYNMARINYGLEMDRFLNLCHKRDGYKSQLVILEQKIKKMEKR